VVNVFFMYGIHARPAISQLDQLLPKDPELKGHHTGLIYSRLFKYTHTHTAGLIENNWGPTPPKAGPGDMYKSNTSYHIPVG
jgi:hypothetical protein